VQFVLGQVARYVKTQQVQLFVQPSQEQLIMILIVTRELCLDFAEKLVVVQLVSQFLLAPVLVILEPLMMQKPHHAKLLNNLQVNIVHGSHQQQLHVKYPKIHVLYGMV
jgi:hypothetical protein